MATDDDLTEFLRVTDVVRIVTTTRDGRAHRHADLGGRRRGRELHPLEFGHDSKWFRQEARNPSMGF